MNTVHPDGEFGQHLMAIHSIVVDIFKTENDFNYHEYLSNYHDSLCGMPQSKGIFTLL